MGELRTIAGVVLLLVAVLALPMIAWQQKTGPFNPHYGAPSAPTEVERMRDREVRALESIAYSLKRIDANTKRCR